MIFREIITNPLLTAFTAFILATFFVVSLTLGFYGYGRNFLENILVEAHGMLLDILAIGIFILWLNRLGEKRLEIRRYQEEIDDFRGWDSDEAGYRIAGNIRRLNRNGVTNIYLWGCHLVKVNLSGTNLYNVNLCNANLSGAILSDANLSDANLSNANLSGAILFYTNLSGADLSDANLSAAILFNANLSGAFLFNANLSDAKGWTNEQLAQARSLVGATLPDGTTIMTEEDEEAFKKRYRK